MGKLQIFEPGQKGGRPITERELRDAARRYSKEAFEIVAKNKNNPFNEPQKPTDGDKKKKKKKGTY